MFTNTAPKNQNYKKRVTKNSAGVACIRYNKKDKLYEVLMVRKRYTYGFASFVFGQYNKRDEKHIVDLLNLMTNQEKLDILSLNFDLMWWRVWCDLPNQKKNSNNNNWTDIYKKKTMFNYIRSPIGSKTKYDLYLKKKAKFECTFVSNTKLLEKLIKRSTSGSELLWEIPKGRTENDENKLDCALREFTEETGICSSAVKILPDVNPFFDIFTHMGQKYNSYYYVGIITQDIEPKISFNIISQLIEIDDIKWVSLDELKFILKNKIIHGHLKKIFKIVKNRYSKYSKEFADNII